MADPVVAAPPVTAPSVPVVVPVAAGSVPLSAAPPSPAAPIAPVAAPVPAVAEVKSEGAAPAVIVPEAAPSPETKVLESKPAEAAPVAKPSFLETAKPAEAKPATEAKPGEEPAPAAEGDEPADVAPIVYEAFKVPEGRALDPKAVEQFTGILGEARVPQEIGQKMIDLYLGEVDKFGKYQTEVWDRTQEQWLNDIRSDGEIGGSRVETVHRTCGAVIERFGNDKLREVLTMTGAGNHPEVVRFLNKIGEFLGEGKPVPAARPAPAPGPSRAQRRYSGSTLNGATQS